MISNSKSPISKLLPAVLIALTLGLAPFSPPHIVGKIKWVMGGAKGMQPMDWFDLLLHGTPWLFLAYTVIRISYDYMVRRGG